MAMPGLLLLLLLLMCGDVECNPGPPKKTAKDVGNLPSKVFRHFFALMAKALSECPDRMANELYSKGLISTETREEAQIASVPGYKRATTLLSAVQRTLSLGGGDKKLRKLCKMLSQVGTMEELSTKIMGKYERALSHDCEMSSSESERSDSDSERALSHDCELSSSESERSDSDSVTSSSRKGVKAPRAAGVGEPSECTGVNRGRGKTDSRKRSTPSKGTTLSPSLFPKQKMPGLESETATSRTFSQSHTMPQNEATQMEPCQPLPTSSLPHLVLIYKDYLKALYNRRRFPTYFKDPLLQIRPKDFIKVQLLHIDKILTKPDKEEAQGLSFHGMIKEWCEKGKSLDLDQFSELLGTQSITRCLVEGNPGIGKTTFAWELCWQWKEGKLLKDFDLVLLAQVRSDRMRKAVNLLDIVYHPEKAVSEAVINHLHLTNGSRVLIIVEGYDEATSDQQAKESIFSKLLDGTELPHATLLVTSRPPASRVLPVAFCDGRDLLQHIEIVGFTKNEIKLYIESALQEYPDILVSFRSYLKSNPLPHSLMYIPLQCSLLTELYAKHWRKGDKEFAPKTMTELYTAVVMSLLLRYLSEQKGDPHRNDKITKFSELPEDVYHKLMDLAKTAAEGIEKKEYSFTDLPEDTMGLTQKMEELYPNMGSGVVTHAFLHLTLQEYLAAYFFAETSSCQLQQLLSRKDLFSIRVLVKSGMKQKRMSTDSGYHWPVLLFLGGLTGLHQVKAEFFRSFLKNSRVGLKSKFHPSFCRLLYEAQNDVLVESIFASDEFHAEVGTNPMYCYVYGYCIAHSSSTASWSVTIRRSGENQLRLFEAGLKLCQGGRITTISVVTRTMSSDLCRFIDYCSHGITELSFHDVKASRQQTVKLASSSSTSLRHLSFEGCHPHACIPFLASLSQYSSLEYLMLRVGLRRVKSVHGELDNFISVLSRALQSPHCHVKTLTLTLWNSHELSPESEVEFLQAVAMNKSLHRLEYGLANCHSHEVFATLAHLLQHQTTLSVVELEPSLDSIEGVLLLVQAMNDSNVTCLKLRLATGTTSKTEWMATLREHSFPSNKITLRFC